jgi:O-antigen biosynthesis protein
VVTEDARRQRPAVCIVGVPRSGGSAVARLVGLLGVDIAPEHRALADISDEILRRFGGTWSSPPALRPGWEESPEVADLHERAAALIARDFGSRRIWGWNDPQVSLTLPFWRQLLPHLRPIVCLRNPLEVARSLERAHGLSYEDGSRLWVRYITAALANSRECSRHIVWYEDVLANARRELARCATFLQRPYSADTAAQADSVIDTRLHYDQPTLAEVVEDRRLDPAARAFFGLIANQRDQLPQRHVSDRTWPEELDAAATRLHDRQSATEWLTEQVAHLASAREESRREADRLREEFAKTESEAAQIRNQMAQLTVSPAWRLASRLGRLRQRVAPDGSSGHRLLQLARRLRHWRSGVSLGGSTATRPLVSLLLPIDGTVPATVLESVGSVLDQSEARWELLLVGSAATGAPPGLPPDPRIDYRGAGERGRAAALNAGLARARGTFVAVVEPGDHLVSSALELLLKTARSTRADAVYCDEESLQEMGPPSDTFAKPDWSPELLLAFPYTGRLCLLRREIVQSLGGWKNSTAAAEDYALLLGMARQQRIIRRVDRTLYQRRRTHITDILSTPDAIEARTAALVDHLGAIARAAKVARVDNPGRLRVQLPVDGQPLVSIIIPTRDRVSLLDRCIRSIENTTDYPHFEIIIVDNDSAEAETRAYFERTRHTVVRWPGQFNFSAINNAGARAARGDYLLFLNNDTEVLTRDWLVSMLEWAQQPEIGCVGAKLLFPDDTIQHVGVTLHDGSAFHPCYGRRPEDRTWVESELVRNFSAVTGACLMIRSRLFEELSGFDETFPVAYNDVDLCVRVMRAGYRNLYTPYTVLYHHESSSRPPGVTIAENEHLRQVVGGLLWADPYCPRNQWMETPPAAPPKSRRSSGVVGRIRHVASRSVDVFSAAIGQRMSFKNISEVGGSASADMIRWIDRIEIGQRVRIGLFMHPISRRTFQMSVDKGAQFVTWIALLPEVWERNRGGVRFEAIVSVDGVERAVHEWTIDPHGRSRDRRWTRVTVPLAAFAGQTVNLTLATSLPAGAAPAHSWAVWGDPILLRRKSIVRVIQRQTELIRSIGVRAALRRYSRLLRGASMDASLYDGWFQQQHRKLLDSTDLAKSAAALAWRPRISIITPVYNTEPRWLKRAVESVQAQAYPEWELCLADDGSTRAETTQLLAALGNKDSRIKVITMARNGGISAASNGALEAATGEFIALLDHDDEIPPEALLEVAKVLNEHPDADVIYSDEDKLEFDGTHSDPFFKPDWSPEYLRSCMYLGHLGVYRRELVTRIGGFRPAFDGSQDYDLALRATEGTDRIHHIARILYHWRKIPGSAAGDQVAKPWAIDAAKRALTDHLSRQPIPAEVIPDPGNGLWRVKYRISGDPLVTIIIPTAGRIARTSEGHRDVLLQCLRSIVERTAYKNYELLIVDTGRLSPQVFDFLRTVPHRRVVHDVRGGFNFAATINAGARQAKGDHLLLLNDDTEVISEEWMSAMLEFSQQPKIGAVGGKLFYPDGRIQHVGVVLGIGGGACHVLAGQSGDTPGYFGSALVIKNYSAVTAACCMTRRAVFEDVGGFDERFAVDFNDVDYCLRVRARGYRVVGTPFAKLYHFEGASFGSREHVVNPAEINALNERWQDVIDQDPYYNPNLTRSALDYSLRL